MKLDDYTFVQILQAAVAGSHSDLERILEEYEPLIRKYSYLNGVFDAELHQYLLIHIALNIHKFTL